MTDITPKHLQELYQQMYELTEPECRKECRNPRSCCSPEYCDFAIHYASERGVKLEPTGHPKLPLMGPTGCIVPPHLRPMCTFHTCDMNGLGYKKNDPEGAWNKKYFDLRGLIEEAEMTLREQKWTAKSL